MKIKNATNSFHYLRRIKYKQLLVVILFAFYLIPTIYKEVNARIITPSLAHHDLQYGYSDYKKATEKAASWLLSWQNDDGGWSSHIPKNQLHSSWPQSTAKALLALLDFGVPIDSTPLTKAVYYLSNINLDEQKREVVSLVCLALDKADYYSEEIATKIQEIETWQSQVITQRTEFDIDANYPEILTIYSVGFITGGYWSYDKIEAVEWFGDFQNEDGSFGDYGLDFDKRILTTAKYVEIMAVFDSNTVDTFLRGESFLEACQNDDGSWGSPWPSHEITCHVLRALLKAENASSGNIARGLEWLILKQSADGSWGSGILNRYVDWVSLAVSVLCESIALDLNRSISLGTNFLKRWQGLDGGFGDVYETCRILNLLADLGESLESPTLRKAVNWLLANQSTDGTWEYETSFVISTLLKVGVNPEVEEIKKAVIYLKQNLDDFYYGPCNIEAVIEAGESLSSREIQETIALVKTCQEPDGSFIYRFAYPEKDWRISRTCTTVNFLLRVGTDSQSDTIKNAIVYLLDQQEPNGSWLNSPGYTFGVCFTLIMAGVGDSHPQLQEAGNWALNFLETNDFDWGYHLYDIVGILTLIGDNSDTLKRIETEILKEQRIESNLREFRKEYSHAREDISCLPDGGWPSVWNVESEIAWWSSVYGTCAALESLCIIRDGLETPGSKPFLSVVVYLPVVMIVDKDYMCIVKITPIDISVGLTVAVESVDFNIEPQSTSAILPMQEEHNFTFRITTLSKGIYTLRVSTLYNETILNKRILVVTIRESTIFDVFKQVASVSVVIFLLYWIILGFVPIMEYRLSDAQKRAGFVPFTGVTLSLLAFHYTLLNYMCDHSLINKPAYVQYLVLTTAISLGLGVAIYLFTLKYDARINDAINNLIKEMTESLRKKI